MVIAILISDENEQGALGIGRQQREGFQDKRAREVINEDELRFAVAQEHGDGVGVEAGVYVVKDGPGHRDGKVELVHGGNVGSHNGHNVAPLDAERCDRGGHLEASTVGLRPRVGGVVVDDRRAITIHSSGSFQEA